MNDSVVVRQVDFRREEGEVVFAAKDSDDGDSADAADDEENDDTGEIPAGTP